MGSSRLPGKILADIEGRPMLWYTVARLRHSRLIDRLVIATSSAPADDAIESFCRREGVDCFRGDEQDVLDRFYKAALWAKAVTVVRLSGDSVLIDPAVVDNIIEVYLSGDYAYVGNSDPATYPDGFDTEAFSFSTLERAWREARKPSEREHVTPYIRSHPDLFPSRNVHSAEDLSDSRWTVDEPRDLEFMRAVYRELGGTAFSTQDVVDLLARRPELRDLNAGLIRDEGWLKSQKRDEELGYGSE